MKILKVPDFIHPQDRIRYYKKQAKSILAKILGFEPETLYAEEEIDDTSALLYSRDRDEISEKDFFITASDYISSIRETIKKCHPTYHHLLDIEIDQEFAKKVKIHCEADDNYSPSYLVNYQTKYIEFKEDARQYVINELGFEPKLRISLSTELRIREQFHHVKTGKRTTEQAEKSLAFCIQTLKNVIYKELPEQAHLIKIQDIIGLPCYDDSPNIKPKLKSV